ncbi:MAG: hypothetical protein IJV08_03295 [Bacteroidaceae bacterium]|nr:hypothetical protein [Bacteroidaceae bacterium]
MKSKEVIGILACILFFVSSCNGGGNSSSYTPITYETEEGYSDYPDEEHDYYQKSPSSQYEDFRLTGRIETCNKCMGYGMVQDGLYGQPEICKFCWISTNMRIQQGWTGFDGRYGQVDAAFNSLPADYFDSLNWNSGENDNGDENNGREQIEEEIARHERNLESLQEQAEYIEGGVNSNYIREQIVEEEYEIRRLRRMLGE